MLMVLENSVKLHKEIFEKINKQIQFIIHILKKVFFENMRIMKAN